MTHGKFEFVLKIISEEENWVIDNFSDFLWNFLEQDKYVK